MSFRFADARVRGLSGLIVSLVVLAGCQSAAIPGYAKWTDELEALDVPGRMDPRGRVDAPGFDHYVQPGRDISLTPIPRAIAVLAPSDGTPDAAPEHVQLAGLTDEAIRVQSTDEGAERAAYDAAVARFGAGNVGYPVLVALRSRPPEDWPAAVLTPDIVATFTETWVFKGETAGLPGRLDQILVPLGLQVVDSDPDNPTLLLLRAGGNDPNVWLEASRRLRARPECAGVSTPDLIFPLAEHSLEQDESEGTVDPLRRLQWHLRNDGTAPINECDTRLPLPAAGLANADARVLAAWEIVDEVRSDGDEERTVPTIAVIDPSGVEWQHPDLIDRHRALTLIEQPGRLPLTDLGWDFRPRIYRAISAAAADDDDDDDDDKRNKDDDAAHGTQAAGVALATRGNVGVCGVAPDARLLPIRIRSSGYWIARAIRFASFGKFTFKGADVLSMSFGFERDAPTPQIVKQYIAAALDRGRDRRGTIVVCSLSNLQIDNFATEHPGMCAVEGVMAIGRSTNMDLWGKSGFGLGMSLLAPTGAAPSTDETECVADRNQYSGTLEIVTTDRSGKRGTNNGRLLRPSCTQILPEITCHPDYTNQFHGTSAATPIVAGCAALVLMVNPELSGRQVRAILEETARRIDDGPRPDDEPYELKRGNGCVNAEAAVRRALETDAEPPPGGPGGKPPAVAAMGDGEQIRPGVRIDSTVAQPRPALLIELTDGSDPVEIGTTTTYTLDVTNQGASEARNVVIRFTWPETQTLVSVDTSGAGRAVHTIVGRTASLAPLEVVGPKGEINARATVRVTMRANAEAAVRFEASVSADGLSRPITESESTSQYVER